MHAPLGSNASTRGHTQWPLLMYADFVQGIARSFDDALAAIETVHNFELGGEFEIAICETLRRVLPNRFGICRGYVVDSAGAVAGDDVIIYERLHYPTSRLLREEDYARKEKIPIEAAFAYVEAKHTLQIEGDGESSLRKAVSQTASVKRLCQQREPVPLSQIARGINLGANLTAQSSAGWPDKRNPFYTVILARRVRLNRTGPILQSAEEIDRALVGQNLDPELLPDLIVAGPSNVALPVLPLADGQRTIISPFTLDGRTELACRMVGGIAFGVALVHLLWALDYIELGPMPWSCILGDSLDVPARPPA